MKEKLSILGISGSLRAGSYNTVLLEAIQQLAPDNIDFFVFDQIGELPLFNPDRSEERIPVVELLNNAVASADGIVIATPEYAGGVTGVIKNTLDWLVGGPNFINIPIALPNTSPRASLAQAAIRTVLTTMSGVIIEEASPKIPLLSSGLDANGILRDEEISSMVVHLLAEFETAIRAMDQP